MLPTTHSPASSLHSTAPRHSRSPPIRWSRTRCAPHMLLTPRSEMSILSACWPPSSPVSPCPGPTTSLSQDKPAPATSIYFAPSCFLHCPYLGRLGSNVATQEACPDPIGPWTPLTAAHSTSTPNCLCGPEPNGDSTHLPLPAPSHSRSSPQCSGSAALARCRGPREQEEGVPGAGGPTW